ncbi:sigma-70 family RNA polymerase sigma factor [Oceanobacillus bengalensis]|uniref:Sigma-70 family RNA polymerase sigma factor n=1 Tax=Oceanobacillus bengalensis TaxID=1435466 RepID=A0A494YSV1_9BACI|nr:sigma-70 family RNA polymerase sigma factor [Oceanobacillus bengalensis]RKQ13192.1 sigma-70 family RNA polymerase sigma factor [Oceanobacillus bengalensis]
MKNDNKVTFEEIFQQNEARIHFHVRKLGIHDPYKDFYSEGLYAMWDAYKKYQPDKGPLATYFNYTIRNRLIDMIRKKTRDNEKDDISAQEQIKNQTNGNRYGDSKLPIPETDGFEMMDDAFWKQVKSELTEKQWKWVYYHVIHGMPLKEIAEQEKASLEAVKDWGKQARKKLRIELEQV